MKELRQKQDVHDFAVMVAEQLEEDMVSAVRLSFAEASAPAAVSGGMEVGGGRGQVGGVGVEMGELRAAASRSERRRISKLRYV